MKDRLRALICRWLDWAYREWGQEDRCDICKERHGCPAYKTGVVWPCQHYQEEDT